MVMLQLPKLATPVRFRLPAPFFLYLFSKKSVSIWSSRGNFVEYLTDKILQFNSSLSLDYPVDGVFKIFFHIFGLISQTQMLYITEFTTGNYNRLGFSILLKTPKDVLSRKGL